tara:strand:- start:3380 stop:3964 length:585 start_codon:yes stop_codon:yes gene_type:complete
MSRDLSSAIVSAISADVFRPFFTVDLMFDTGSVTYGSTTVTSAPLYLWTGHGTQVINGISYVGTGQFLEISAFEETAEIAARNATLTLSGIPSDLLALALATPYQGRECIIKFGATDDLTDRAVVFSGYMDQMKILESGDTSRIALTVESRLIDLERARVKRYTSENQKAKFPGDLAFDFVNSLQDQEIFWGRR